MGHKPIFSLTRNQKKTDDNPKIEIRVKIPLRILWVYVPIFSGLGFNFRVKWFMGLCPYFYFIRVKLFGLNIIWVYVHTL